MAVTPVYVEGWEHGVLSVAGLGIVEVITGSGMSINSTGSYVRTGTYSLKAVGTSGETSVDCPSLTGSPTIIVGCLYFLWHTLPNIPITFARVYVPVGSTVRICFDPADQKVYGRFTSDGPKANVVLAQDTWYRIDFKGDVSANPSKIDLQVNGVAAAQTTFAQAATYFQGLVLGLIEISPTISSGEIYIDDVILSVTSAQYPIGSEKVTKLSPNAEGTHNSGTVIKDQAGNVINGTTYTANDKLNSIPIGDATKYIEQTGTGTGNYAEVGFGDTAETTIYGVMAFLAYKSANTQSNNGQARIRDGAGQETTIYSGDMSETSNQYKSKLVTVPVAGWSQTTVNALLGRVGYSSDANPVPYWLDVVLQVASVAGTINTQTNTGSLTPSGTLVLVDKKTLTGGVTPAGILNRLVNKITFAGSLTPTGIVNKLVSLVAFTGSITPTGALNAIKVAMRTFLGSITPTGGLTNLISSTKTGSITPTGIVSRSTNKTVAGSITPAGTLVSRINKIVTGALAPAGTLVNKVTRFLMVSGVLTPSGSLNRKTITTFTGSIIPSGILTKITSLVAFTGSITPTGALTNIKAFIRVFSGSITPSGTLVRSILKPITGSVTPTGTLTKLISKITFTGSITPTGALSAVKAFVRSFSGSITPSGTLSRVTNKVVSGAIAPVGILTRFVSKLMTGSLSPSGILNVIKTGGGAVIQAVMHHLKMLRG